MQSVGNTHLHYLNPETLQRLSKAILAPNQMANWVRDIEADAWENSVLSNFLENDPATEGNERLVEIPTSRKKRWVILKWLVQKFEIGTLYPEKELNAIIQQHYWDSATLRREMIGYQMMKRERGVYWRTPEEEWKPMDWSGAIAL